MPPLGGRARARACLLSAAALLAAIVVAPRLPRLAARTLPALWTLESWSAALAAAVGFSLAFAVQTALWQRGVAPAVAERRPSGPAPGSVPCEREAESIRQLRLELQGRRVSLPPDALLLQLAWARELDVSQAADLWCWHLIVARQMRISDVTDKQVEQAYGAGFCVRAGHDVDRRPMIWVRMALSEPARLSPALVVRNTWLAQDATLCGRAEANRLGICFVYDLRGVGWRNLAVDPAHLRAALRGATSHPSHISRVWLLNAPAIFLWAWAAFKHFVPGHLRGLVRFLDAEEPGALGAVCPPAELPAYLGGDAARFGGPFVVWMFDRLRDCDLAYRPSPGRAGAAVAADVAPRASGSGAPAAGAAAADAAAADRPLETRFQEAVGLVKTFQPADPSKSVPNDRKLILYGLFKQVREGDARGARPSAFSLEARYKFDAWARNRGRDKEACMREYIAELAAQIREFS